MKTSLGYLQVACSQCGAARVVSVACPECGALPDAREADPERQRRTRRGQLALEALDANGIDKPTTPLWTAPGGTVWDELASWLEHFLAAIADVGTPGTDDSAAVVQMTRRLAAMRASSGAVLRLRPWLAVWQTVDEILERFGQVARSYLGAISSDIPLAAQKAARTGQRAIDEAEVIATDFTTRLRRANRLSEGNDPVDTLTLLVVEARTAANAQDVFDVEAAGQAIYTRVTGSVDGPPGLGVTLALADVLVDVALDRDRFWGLVGDVFRRLVSNPQALLAVIASPSWQADIEDATQRLFDSAVAQHAVAAAVTRDRDHVRAALTLSQDVLEGAAKRYFATLISVLQRDDYEQLRCRDSAALVHQAAQLGIGDVTGGLDERLRQARAHEDFRIECDRVVITDHGRTVRELEFEELVDAVLKGLESTIALQVAVTCAAAHAGFDLTTLDPAKTLAISATEKVAIIAALAGWTEVEVEQEDKTIIVRGDTETRDNPLRDAAMIVPYIDPGTDWLELVSGSEHDTTVLKGPLDPLRRFQAENKEPDKMATYVEAAVQWTLDGEPVLGVRAVDKWAAMALADALSAAPAERARQIKFLQDLARRIGIAPLETRLGLMLAVVRNNDLGLPLSDAEREALSWFSAREQERLTES
jgi:hypothetical protein